MPIRRRRVGRLRWAISSSTSRPTRRPVGLEYSTKSGLWVAPQAVLHMVTNNALTARVAVPKVVARGSWTDAGSASRALGGGETTMASTTIEPPTPGTDAAASDDGLAKGTVSAVQVAVVSVAAS